MKKGLAIITGLGMTLGLFGQTATQTIRGTVVDKESKFPLIGVNVILVEAEGELKGTVTDQEGVYVLENVPVGRRTLEFSYLGYEKVLQGNIVVTSGKEVIVDAELEESAVEFGTEVIVTAQSRGDARNEMAPVSARQFSVEETDRYAGSRGDPGRMASNFAGVQGADDSRNDIVIRGNSPQGLLWRFEGVNIPNPNHFAISGTAGGPLTILNNKYLDNSDFFTGAFPAEFGNGIAGVFDLRMRNGNAKRHEVSAQLGFLGTELFAEGPLTREKKSSYLVSYRYSTLSLFSFLGIKVGTDAIPKYQDGAFRLNFPTKQGGSLALWGIGGRSRIEVIKSDLESPSELDNPDLYSESDRDQIFKSEMGVVGLTYTRPLNISSFFKATFSASTQFIKADHWKIIRHVENDRFVIDSLPLPRILSYGMRESKYSVYLSYNTKLSKLTTLKAGLNTDYFAFAYVDSFRTVLFNPEPEIGDWRVRWDTRGKNAVLLQPYIQLKHRIGEKFSILAGLTSLYFSLNDQSFSPVEPRLGLVYEPGPTQRISLGYGLHSQTLPPYIYFYGKETINRDPQEHNIDLGLYKSHQVVLSYDRSVGKGMRLKLEAYYQSLFNIPVEKKTSAFSLVNSGSGFSRLFPDTLVNTGKARNYGFEVTLERHFSGGYYFLFTGSLFDSKYRGSDGVLRNTTYNGRVALNGIFAREFTFAKGSALNTGIKLTYAGGRWRGEADREASDQNQEIIYIDQTTNSIQLRPYFRGDLKISYRWNRPKVLHEFSIDLVNLTNYQNLLYLTYVPDHPSGEPVQETYQLRFLPIFYYKLDFSL